MLDDAVQHFSLEALRTFVAVAECRNFTTAGREVCRTQSAVSMQIKKLETELGRRLFSRNAREVRLTPEGQALLGYARRLLRLNDEAVAAFAAPQLSGSVCLGMPDDFATRHLPGILARFRRAYPLVHVDVRSEASADLLRGLRIGTVDVCLTVSDEASEGTDQGSLLARPPLVWIGAGDVEPEAIWSREGDPLPLAVFHEGCVYRRLALATLERANIPYRIVCSSVSLAAILAAVRSGYAIAPVTHGCVDRTCRVLPAESGLPALPAIRVVLHERNDPARPAVACLARFVEESCSAVATAG